MTIQFRIALAALVALGLPVGALATIPGNLEQEAYENLQHVCTDTEPNDVDDYIECIEQEGDVLTAPYTGSECVTAGLPAACVLDFIPKVKLKATLLLVHDDTAEDGGGGSIPASSVVVELKKGKKKATLIELFDGASLGNWNSFDEFFLVNAPDINFTNDGQTAYQFAGGTLFELGLEVREIATNWFPKADLSDAVAVLTAIALDPKRAPLDHDDADLLASGANFKIEIQFVRTRP
jgi:hypothetical protein